MKTKLKAMLTGLTSAGGVNATSLEDALERPGTVCEVDEETYSWYLDVLPPHLMDGGFFCFAEGFVPYTLFWRAGGRFFAKQLTWAETSRLARFACVPQPGVW